MLSKYSDKELRDELKRRAKEHRTSNRKPTEYFNIIGVVGDIDNVLFKYRNKTRYMPYSKWGFKINNIESEVELPFNLNGHCFRCALNKSDAPRIGDKVTIRCRKTKKLSAYNICNSKIVSIIK